MTAISNSNIKLVLLIKRNEILNLSSHFFYKKIFTVKLEHVVMTKLSMIAYLSPLKDFFCFSALRLYTENVFL